MSNKLFRTAIVALLAAVLNVSACARAAGQNEAAAGQNEPKKEEQKQEKEDAKKDAKKETPQGTPVFWQEPTDIASRNLLLGAGGEEMKPDLSQVIWEGQGDEVGYSVKWRVRDAAGRHWVAKLGNEAQPETAASRLVWAAGYPTEITYLAPCVKIVNAPKPKKDVKRCEDKGFANVRFEARPEGHKRLDEWSWNQNPFSGSKEFAGFVVMMGLVNNWDLKDSNNKVVYVPREGGDGELRYVVSDLGATFGKTGNFITHSRNEPEKYVKTGFVDKIKGNRVKFNYNGKKGSLFDNITVEQAAWIGSLLARLSDKQIEDAFRAANYTDEEVRLLAAAVRSRIDQLAALK